MQHFQGKVNEVLKQTVYPQADGSGLTLLSYPLLDETNIVKHCFTTKLGGVSEGEFATMNLSFTRGDREEAVRENYDRIARAMGVEPENFVFSDQTHTTNVRLVTREDAGKGFVRPRDYTDVDGLITDEPGLTLVTFYADCVPLYFVDPVHRAIGLAHSGWRGTAARMGAVTVAAMGRAFGTKPEDLICAIGPSICGNCYEVGEEVAKEFLNVFAGCERELLTEKPNHKYLLDLWRANERVLWEAGVRRDHLAVGRLCTCCNAKMLFSHRATGGKRGNLGAFLCLR